MIHLRRDITAKSTAAPQAQAEKVGHFGKVDIRQEAFSAEPKMDAE